MTTKKRKMEVGFIGRVKGAIGKEELFFVEIEADSLEDAREKLYDKYDSVMFLKEIVDSKNEIPSSKLDHIHDTIIKK